MSCKSEYNKTIKNIARYLVIGTIVYICSIYIRLFTWDYKDMIRMDILGDINGANIAVGIIAICSCVLYYYIYREIELFLLISVYLSVYMQYVIQCIIENNILIQANYYVHMLFCFIFRIILILMAINSESKLVKKVTKNKKLFLIISIPAIILISIIDLKLSGVYSELGEKIVINIQHILGIYYYYLLYKVYKISLRKNRLIYTIFTSSLGILNIGRPIFIIGILDIVDIKLISLQCKYIAFIGFILLFIGLCIDVMITIKNEKKLYSEVKSKEDIFNTITGNAKDMIITTKNECIRYVNSEAELILGYKKEEMIGRKIYDFIDSEGYVISDEDDKTEFIEQRWKCKNGDLFITETMVNKVISEKKEVVDKIIVARNNVFGEKVRNLEKKYNEVKELEKIRGQFFANISHELKTPINIIYSCMQLLENYKGDNKKFIEIYNKYEFTIKQNCYRMIRLGNNLVDITRIDSGFMNMNFINYDIVNLVENITLSVVPYVEEKDINIIFDTYVEELEIKCDPDSIERIILNLLSNSVKFTNRGGNILVFMDADEEFVTISIKDDGIGIPEEIKDSVFERFVQADKSFNRKNEGSGIGLALTKSLIELHDGKIELKSKEGKGSEIIIKLPNIKCNEVKSEIRSINTESKPIADKVNIEFSDIYELY